MPDEEGVAGAQAKEDGVGLESVARVDAARAGRGLEHWVVNTDTSVSIDRKLRTHTPASLQRLLIQICLVHEVARSVVLR